MISPADSLLKYDNPVQVRKSSGAKSKGRGAKATAKASAKASAKATPQLVWVPPPPRQPQNEEILNSILPPRKWAEGSQQWVQKVSSAPCARTDVVHLSEQLNTKLEEQHARHAGICPVRREFYSQCFDELIRQVTVNCAERGLLLLQVRDEIKMTVAAYRTIYESSLTYGMRKALQAERGTADIKSKITELKQEKRELIKQINEQKVRGEDVEKREEERREVEDKKLAEEILFLQQINTQLKAQLEGFFKSE